MRLGRRAPVVPHAHAVGVVEGAERLPSALCLLGPDDRVVVSRAGLTGIETVAEIAERYSALVRTSPLPPSNWRRRAGDVPRPSESKPPAS